MKEQKSGPSAGAKRGGPARKPGKWSESAVRVLNERYVMKDEQGRPTETPDELIWRVARAVASAENRWTEKSGQSADEMAEAFYELMVSRQFLPNSPTLMNAGKGNNLQLSACYVVPVEDSLSGIFGSLKNAALIHQSGGGVGYSFSRLRPKGSIVNSTRGVASGPVSFMRIFDAGTEAVKQGGCVVPETRVATTNGLVQIGTLGPREAEPKSWHPHAQPVTVYTDEGSRTSDEFYYNGVAAIRRLRTTHGYHFAGTLEHRVRVIDQHGAYVWRHLKDVQVGDWVALQKYTYPETTDYRFPPSERIPHFNAKQITIPERPTAELGEFVGYVIGDGCINYHDSQQKLGGRLILAVAHADADVGEQLLRLAKDLFGVTASARTKPNDASTNYFFTSTEVVAWLEHIGVSKPSTLNVRVPEAVFRAGAAFARGFLRGLFTADGTITAEGYPSFCSISRGLVEDVQQLLLALGIPSHVSVTTKRAGAFGTNPIYRLHVITREGLRQFALQIGFMSAAKNARLEAGLKKAWEFNDVIPNQHALVAALYAGPGRGSGPGRSPRGANRSLYRDVQHYLPGVQAPRQLTRSRLQALAEKHAEVRASALAAFLSNGQFYDQIASIEEDESVTVDLSVAQNHTYIANSFVSHNTRRGANMGILRVDHPDIFEFIDCKRDGSITNFNISVAITDEFMRALREDGEYELISPHTKKVVRRVRAREVMDRIVSAAWATGDPGLVFLDRANSSTANPTPEIELLESTNPCLVGETRLSTSTGLRRMDALHASQEAIQVVTDLSVLGLGQVATINGFALRSPQAVAFHDAAPVFQTGKQVPVWRLVTSHGIEVIATPNHRFLTTQGYKRLDELQFEDTLILQGGEGAWSKERTLPKIIYGERSASRLRVKMARGEIELPTEWSAELGEMMGYVLGDGYVRREGASDIVGIAVAQEDQGIADQLQERFNRWFGAAGNATKRQGHIQLMYAGSVGTFLLNLGIKPVRAHEKRVPETIFAAPRDAVIGFLRGLFSADGSVQIGPSDKGTCSVRLATSSKGLAQDVQQLLLNLGIVSAIRLRRQAQLRLMPNSARELAEYSVQAQYEVMVDKANRDRFAEVIGFMQASKQSRLKTWIANKKRVSNSESFITKVAVIEDAGLADVYDTTEPVTHSVIANGLVVHNCGEQYLGPYDACNLGSINLGLFVRDGKVDYTALDQATRLCTRFLDDVIEINPFPLPEVREKVYANRRIGLGVMGWAEMLFELGLRYDSDEAITLGDEVMRFIERISTEESQKMAEERGEFPNFSRSIYKNDPRLRNSTRTTVAPTGSISILADCSSGIEPIFALAFQHRVKQPDGSYRVLDFVNPFFQRALEESDIADKESVLAFVKEHGALHGHPAEKHPALQRFVTAHEIAPEWHIRMQAAFQPGVNNSISKTVNLPNSATKEDVERAYMLAWDLGCLGITIFRDGSKGEQVLNVGVKASDKTQQTTTPAGAQTAPRATAESDPDVKTLEAAEQEEEQPALPVSHFGDGAGVTGGVKPRPPVVYGYTRQIRAPEGKVNITLNSDQSGLLEVFVNVGRAGSDIAALAEALGRLISLHLRVDSPLSPNDRAREIVDQLRGIGGSRAVGFGPNQIRSLPDAVARALEIHLEDHLGQGPSASAPTASQAPAEQQRIMEAEPPPAASPHAPNGTANGTSGGTLLPQGGLVSYRVTGNLCPQCGSTTLVYEEGCKKCYSCGYSEC
ncbi:MAG TPA: LAGLIDADG family homing endonuclease [Ktedonobacterales bacterium]